MARYAIVDVNNNVVNVVLWDGVAPWSPPQDTTAVYCVDDQCDIGGTYDPIAQTFTAPQISE